MNTPETYHLADDGSRFPNSPLPLLVYRAVLPPDPAAMERAFADHGWSTPSATASPAATTPSHRPRPTDHFDKLDGAQVHVDNVKTALLIDALYLPKIVIYPFPPRLTGCPLGATRSGGCDSSSRWLQMLSFGRYTALPSRLAQTGTHAALGR